MLVLLKMYIAKLLIAKSNYCVMNLFPTLLKIYIKHCSTRISLFTGLFARFSVAQRGIYHPHTPWTPER